MADEEMTKEETRKILTEIAREPGNAAARIAAIKELRALDGDDSGSGDGDVTGMEEFMQRRGYQTKTG